MDAPYTDAQDVESQPNDEPAGAEDSADIAVADRVLDIALSERVRETLRGLGATDDQIDQAFTDDSFHLLGLDLALLGPGRRYSEREVCQAAGISIELAVRFRNAFGFPDAPLDAPIYGEKYAGMLKEIARFLEFDTDLTTVMQLARVIGQSMARIAEAEIGFVGKILSEVPGMTPGDPRLSAELTLATPGLVEESLPRVLSMIEMVHKRHLLAEAQRSAPVEPGTRARVIPLAVGFADLAGFTAISEVLGQAALTVSLARFETVGSEAVTGHRGRVVKMIGDEIMFVADDDVDAAEIALRLVEGFAAESGLPDVRVGVASGDSITRDGDVFGRNVNLASRLTALANPGTVIISESIEASLEGRDEFKMIPLRPRHLKGIGKVPAWVLRRHGDPDTGVGYRDDQTARGHPGNAPKGR